MSRLRVALLAASGGSLLVGGVAVVAAANGWLPVRPTDAVVVSVVVALTTAAMVVGIHWGEGVQQSAVDPPEPTTGHPRPGVELRPLDEGRWPVGTRRRRAIRERLRAVATRTVARREDVPEAAAARALDDGTWTDDAVAAALFTPSDDALDRVRDVTRFRRRARRAALAVDRLARGER
jgi:hypothetical protein